MKLKWMRICAVVLTVFTLLMTGVTGGTVYAFDNSVKEGAVAVVFYLKDVDVYTFDSVTEDVTYAGSLKEVECSSGSGFFIGSAAENPQYIVTNCHVIENYVSAGEGEEISLIAGYDDDGNLIIVTSESCELRIYYSTDDYDIAYVDCYGDSEKVDLAVLRLRNATDKRRALQIMEPTDDMVGDTIYTVGYPANADNIFSGASQYGVDDATVHRGSINRFVVNDGKGVERIAIDATIQHGNSGGPLVTEEGYVIGVNTNVYSTSPYENQIEADYYAISASELTRFLEKNNISYEQANPNSQSTVNVAAIIGVAAAVLAVVLVVVLLVVNSKKKKLGSAAGDNKSTAGAGGNVISPTAPAPAPEGALRFQGTAGVFAGKRYAIKGIVRIGRDPSKNDVVFPANVSGISRVHCVVLLQNGQAYIKDLGSTHGTFLGNGQRLAANQAVPLQIGDRFYLGSEQQAFVVTGKGGI